jgi:hypothetical protein
MQFGIFGLGVFQDGDFKLSVLPEGKEVLVGRERPHASGVGIRALRSSRLQSVGTRQAGMRQGARPAVLHYAAVVEDFLKLGGC